MEKYRLLFYRHQTYAKSAQPIDCLETRDTKFFGKFGSADCNVGSDEGAEQSVVESGGKSLGELH